MANLTLDDVRSKKYKFKYDPSKYPFVSIMRKILEHDGDLKKIHMEYASAVTEQVTFENDTATYFHKKYYKSPIYHEMIELYTEFLRSEVLPQFAGEQFVVQKEPSFRIHLPKNTALGKRSDQSDDEIIGLHCDSEYGHPDTEMNIMLSLTGQSGTNSCYIESAPLQGDYAPLEIAEGEYMIFYGNKCRHFNKRNLTEDTRISFDFRVIPAHLYEPTETGAIHSQKKFVVGGYYTEMNVSSV